MKDLLFADKGDNPQMIAIRSKIKDTMVDVAQGFVSDDTRKYIHGYMMLILVTKPNGDVETPFKLNPSIVAIVDKVKDQFTPAAPSKGSNKHRGSVTGTATMSFREQFLKTGKIEALAVSMVKELMDQARDGEGKNTPLMVAKALKQTAYYIKPRLPAEVLKSFDMISIFSKDKFVKKEIIGPLSSNKLSPEQLVYSIIPKISIETAFASKNGMEQLAAKLQKLKKLSPDTLEVIGGKKLLVMIDKIDEFVKLVDPAILNAQSDPLAAIGALGSMVIKQQDDDDEEGEGEEENQIVAKPSPNQKLQMMLRRAAEYALLHELWGSFNRRIRDALAIISLFLVFSTSLALFSGLSSTIGGALVAGATFVDIIRRSYDANNVMAKNFEWQRLYNNLVNDLTYTLMLETEQIQDEDTDRFSADFYNIKRKAPFVPPSPVLGFIRELLTDSVNDSDEERIFEIICFDDYQPRDILIHIPNEFVNTRKAVSLGINVLTFLFPRFFRSAAENRKIARAKARDRRKEKEELDEKNKDAQQKKTELQEEQKKAKETKKKEMGLEYSATANINEGDEEVDTCFTCCSPVAESSEKENKPCCSLSSLDCFQCFVCCTDDTEEYDSSKGIINAAESILNKPDNFVDDLDEEEYGYNQKEYENWKQAFDAWYQGKILKNDNNLGLYGSVKVHDQDIQEEDEFFFINDIFLLDMVREIDLVKEFDRITDDFNIAVNSMPIVDRPLPRHYYFNNMRVALAQYKNYAPTIAEKKGGRNESIEDVLFLDQWNGGHHDDEGKYSERRVKVLYDTFCRATELRTINRECALANRSVLRSIELVCLTISASITIALLIAPTVILVQLVTGILAAVISGLVSWTKFRNYESTAAGNELAYARFANISTDIESIFVKLKTAQRYMFGCNRFLLERLDELDFDYDDDDDEDHDDEVDEEEGEDDEESDDDEYDYEDEYGDSDEDLYDYGEESDEEENAMDYFYAPEIDEKDFEKMFESVDGSDDGDIEDGDRDESEIQIDFNGLDHTHDGAWKVSKNGMAALDKSNILLVLYQGDLKYYDPDFARNRHDEPPYVKHESIASEIHSIVGSTAEILSLEGHDDTTVVIRHIRSLDTELIIEFSDSDDATDFMIKFGFQIAETHMHDGAWPILKNSRKGGFLADMFTQMESRLLVLYQGDLLYYKMECAERDIALPPYVKVDSSYQNNITGGLTGCSCTQDEDAENTVVIKSPTDSDLTVQFQTRNELLAFKMKFEHQVRELAEASVFKEV